MVSTENLRAIARPMAFDTGVPAAPFSLLGTWFMARYGRHIFAITARHVARNHPRDQLALFPTDSSDEKLRVDTWWPVADGDRDSDRADIFLASVAFKHLTMRARQRSQMIDLDPQGNAQWFADRHTSKFFLCGYPSSITEVDYDHSSARTRQVLVSGNYTGPSYENGLHELHLENPLNVDFNGLSGAPVFSVRHEFLKAPPVWFCGMALRGSGESGVLHFIDAAIIRQLIADATVQETRTPIRRA